MKRVLLFILCLYAVPAWAQDTPLTTKDYQFVEDTYQSCMNSPQKQQFDCDCAAVRYLDLTRAETAMRERRGETPEEIAQALKSGALRERAFRSCINTDKVAVQNYGRCLNWALMSRDDYREFCSCFAARYADTYHLDGTNPFADPASTMGDAMIYCNKRKK